MHRFSPSSQLVLGAVVAALLMVVLVGLAQGPAEVEGERSSPGATTEGSEAPSPLPSPSFAASAGSTATQAPSLPPQAPTPTATAPRTPVPATTEPTAAPTGLLTLGQLLALLPTETEDRTGYDRDLFNHWIDADGDGCDTRREVLIQEAVAPPAVGSGCSLTGGQWVSLYDGLVFTDPGGLDIDHVVALAESWDSGASGWNADRRQRFANDMDAAWSLIAVSASSNRSKSDQDPADWMPPSAAARCDYLGDWLAVKVRWALSVDVRERSTVQGMIGGCQQTLRPALLAP